MTHKYEEVFSDHFGRAWNVKQQQVNANLCMSKGLLMCQGNMSEKGAYSWDQPQKLADPCLNTSNPCVTKKG